ncbi:MAG TPA: NADH-quinone oxidoreductase subunit L [Phycisphaerales bacterium]|nr:NADH-quinone oxidoreductase subunit L [Phycisphaerales bacterium]
MTLPPALAQPAAAAADLVGTVDLGKLPLLIVALPLVGALIALACAILKVRSKAPAYLMVACLVGAFAVAFWMYAQITGTWGAAGAAGATGGGGRWAVVHAFDWITFQWEGARPFVANFSFYIDSLTCLWMLFVTGLAAAIALYASEYMSHDVGPGYCRFFFAFGLFVFSMACLVMGDNLLLLYLGWEGVGLCSYLLIGYFYQKPSAVEAAKKAFIVNRIGDLGLAIGILLTFTQFGTVRYAELFPAIQKYLDLAAAGHFEQIPWQIELIPVLFTVGAFGKSAQLPLYVWLPDAMEGPTPVSALIHAATMVTAGVYLVARFLPFYQCSEIALPIVAWGGALTALLAATIGMAQFDIKRIMAYSTVSQLGYMFAGLGVLTAANAANDAAGSAFHVFTHAFFKATLFLACGAVMHGFAGQLDLRKLSGLIKVPGWKIVSLAMLVGCLNLAGFPFTAGFFSKDMILANAFSNGHLQAIGWILLITAGLTAYYTFRVFFRVFVGPVEYHPGDEVHAHDDHGHDAHGHHDHAEHVKAEAEAKAEEAHHDFHPHAPGWAINTVLAVLAIASIAVTPLYFAHWPHHLVEASTAVIRTAAAHGDHGHATVFGYGVHDKVFGVGFMYVLSGAVGAVGIFAAFLLHYAGRKTAATSAADRIYIPVITPAAQHKWYVDEVYNWLLRRPLLVLAHLFYLVDKLLIDGLVDLFGLLPRSAGSALRPAQSGVMHGYAVGMACGLAILAVVALSLLNGSFLGIHF